MNITPLIDVLLVLIIIFMLITPLKPHGERALIPQPPQSNSTAVPERTVVVQLTQNGTDRASLKINEEDVPWENLQARLLDIYKDRAEKVLFVKGEPSIDWTDVAEVIDAAHGAMIDKVGLMTPGNEQMAANRH
jgi:biopolymer transport protein ExbD